MKAVEKARAALKPMIDAGIVTRVAAVAPGHDESAGAAGAGLSLSVTVRADPERHRSEAERLLRAAGIGYERLVLHTSPAWLVNTDDRDPSARFPSLRGGRRGG